MQESALNWREAPNQPPRLVLQITVDQLRGDMPRRIRDRLSEGGFRYLMDKVSANLDAHHRHANTETIVGHTTLATVADVMVANAWLDRATDELRYNVEDANYPLTAEGAGVDSSTEIDPSSPLKSCCFADSGQSRRSLPSED